MKTKEEEIFSILETEIETELGRLFMEHALRVKAKKGEWFSDRLGAATLHCMLDLVRTKDIAEWRRRMGLVEGGKTKHWVNEPWAALKEPKV